MHDFTKAALLVALGMLIGVVFVVIGTGLISAL
jgi:hypothetical protein